MPKFKEITKEGKYNKRSHYVGGLESSEPTKEAAYIYAQKCINYYFLLPKWILKNKTIFSN